MAQAPQKMPMQPTGQVDGVDTGEITDGEQEERTVREPKTTWVIRLCFRVLMEHEQAKDAPEQQVEAQGGGISGGDAVEGTDPDCTSDHQKKP